MRNIVQELEGVSVRGGKHRCRHCQCPEDNKYIAIGRNNDGSVTVATYCTNCLPTGEILLGDSERTTVYDVYEPGLPIVIEKRYA